MATPIDKQVIKINFGNISTSDLIAIFDKNMDTTEEPVIKRRFFLEMDKNDSIGDFGKYA